MITLATLASATAQEVFDQAVNHLMTQGEKSERNGKCLYRHGQLKCVAGCFIADEEYKLEMDERAPEATHQDTGWNGLIYLGLVPEAHADLIIALQDIHDACYFKNDTTNQLDSWEYDLKKLASRNDLTYNYHRP